MRRDPSVLNPDMGGGDLVRKGCWELTSIHGKSS